MKKQIINLFAGDVHWFFVRDGEEVSLKDGHSNFTYDECDFTLRMPCLAITPNVFHELHRLLARNHNKLSGPTANELFVKAYDVAKKWHNQPFYIIKVFVGGCNPYYFIKTGGYVICLPSGSSDFAGMDVTYASQITRRYDCWPDVPDSLMYLARLMMERRYTDLQTGIAYEQAWNDLKNDNKEDKKEVEKKDFISRKAIMLFEDSTESNGYNQDVFVWNSVDGIKRMSFAQYLHEVEAEHTGNYKMVKLSRSKLSEIDQTHFDAIRTLRTPVNGDKRGTMYMCFRALWYAATTDLMPASC